MNSPAQYFPPPVAGWQEVVWLNFSLLMFLAWWYYFSVRYRNEFTLSERILGAFVATVGQIEATIFIIGWLHRIGWWELGGINALITFGLIFRTALYKSRVGFLNEIALTIRAALNFLKSSVAICIIGAMALIVAAWYMYLGQLLPPIAYDAWGYHLTWAACAHQERFLGPFNLPTTYINIFPKNTDMLFLWWITGCGTERWANITQGFFGLASVLAGYVISRHVGARRIESAISGLLILSIPVIFHLMWKAMVDLAVMGGCLSAIAFVSRKRITPMSMVLAGCASGFIVGTKGSAVYYYLGIIFLLILRMLPGRINGFRHIGRKKIAPALLTLLIFFIVSFAFGSYYYIRNWISDGNPTGIYDVSIGSLTLFKGEDVGEVHFNRQLMTAPLYDALHESGKSEWPIVLGGFFDPLKDFSQGDRIGGWGAVWTILLLPAIPIALIRALIKRKWLLIGVIASVLVPYFLFKYNHTWTRYHLPIIVSGVVSFAYLLSHLRSTSIRRIFLTIACISMLFTIFISGPQAALTPDEISDARTQPYRQNDRYIFFDSWKNEGFPRVLESVQVPGTTLVTCGAPPAYKYLALWNQAYTNRVVWMQWPGSIPKWKKAIYSEKPYAIYVNPNYPALDWILDHRTQFPLLFQGELGCIFLVKDQAQVK